MEAEESVPLGVVVVRVRCGRCVEGATRMHGDAHRRSPSFTYRPLSPAVPLSSVSTFAGSGGMSPHEKEPGGSHAQHARTCQLHVTGYLSPTGVRMRHTRVSTTPTTVQEACMRVREASTACDRLWTLV